jgi:phosphoserine phosphatase
MRTSLRPLAVLLTVLTAATLQAASDPLPSWNGGLAKASILKFVADVTQPGGAGYVAPAERIAVFDNDGTLWSEQPIYPQVLFGMDRAKAVASAHPQWKEQEPFKSALAGDLKGLEATSVKGLVDLTSGSCAGMTVQEFDQVVAQWLATARHPRFQRPYTDCVYQPMLEVLAWLRANGFKTYVVSGGSVDFLRLWTERVYNVPPEQVIGSTVVMTFEMREGKPVLVRGAETEQITDRAGKALAIQRVIGRRPIAAFGNSDGDLPMLEWTAAGGGRRFCLYVRHTDAEREWAYDRTAAVGRLNKGLDEARAKGWTVVDMKQDWKRVFAFEKE